MIKKMFRIFFRDAKVNLRDFLSLYIILAPILFAVVINLLAPGITDTDVRVAFVKGDNPDQIAYFKRFANVEELKDVEALEERVARRDDTVAVVPNGDGYYILSQGNEDDMIIRYTKFLKTFYEEGRTEAEADITIHEFGVEVPPTKKMWGNVSILFTSLLAGMIIALNIVEEKMDNTVSAINVTPISRVVFIFGKCMMGVLLALLGSLALVFILGFWGVNIGQLLVILMASSVISILIGMIEGITSDDVMTAAGNVKMLFLPLAGSIAGAELLADKWQWVLYWSPFYWAYKGNEAVLANQATWPQVLLYTGIILGISALVYVYLAPKIRKGLEH